MQLYDLRDKMEVTIDLVLTLVTVFAIGMSVGAYFKEKKLEKAFNPYIKKYMSQKSDMWKEFKKRIKV
jgi:hypothetical protein